MNKPIEECEKLTVYEVLHEVACEICDHYCRFQFEVETYTQKTYSDYEENWRKHCQSCPIGRLV